MECRYLTPDQYSKYHRFIWKHPHASIESSVEWGFLQHTIPSRKEFRILAIFEKDEILATALEIPCRLDAFFSFLWIPAGPLLPKDPNKARLCFHLFEKEWKKTKHLFVRIESLIEKKDSPEFFSSWVSSSLSYYPRHTLCLNLQKSLDDIWAEMTQKGRYHIRKAEKAGVRCFEAQSSDLDLYYALMEETASRDGFSIHNKSYYQDFLTKIPGAKLYLASHENQVVAGAICAPFQKTFVYYFGASGASDRKVYASYLLQWTMIQDAKAKAFDVYDFFGLADPDNSDDKLQSVTQFKTRFGGEAKHYTPARTLVLQPLFFTLRNGLLNILRKIRK